MLTVYPNGNESEDGGGHLSLYVTLIGKLISGTSINASLRFFIYDQIRDNYLTFLYVGDKGFNPLKTVWGIPKVLPLEYFTDASNGFLVNDCCSFGAEILIRNGLIKRSSVSLLGTKCERSYTWKLENFSDLPSCLYSPVFTFGKWSWKLLLYPRGNSRSKGKYLSLFLRLDNANELTHGRNLYTKYSYALKITMSLD
ncbi:hypothetical protein RDABS01_023601 [Bienertia sinuspersici]